MEISIVHFVSFGVNNTSLTLHYVVLLSWRKETLHRPNYRDIEKRMDCQIVIPWLSEQYPCRQHMFPVATADRLYKRLYLQLPPSVL